MFASCAQLIHLIHRFGTETQGTAMLHVKAEAVRLASWYRGQRG